MPASLPELDNFRIEISENQVAHLIFDMPDRTMNVFSNKAIHELGAFANWLPDSGVKGVVVCSGKSNAFCVGADLSELGEAYDMIVKARKQDRFNIAYTHFFPLSQAIRALENCGKPVASAIAGLALGGGCELVLGTHYRVLVDSPSAALGLPESLVGLFPGAGGTQRIPRIIGVEASLPILLEGGRLSGKDALEAGLANELVSAGDELAAAEKWVLAQQHDVAQAWDQEGYQPHCAVELANTLQPHRDKYLEQTLGHYPAPLAILDCLQQGLAQDFDGAIRTEMSLFSYLIQRREPRNMIQTLFSGKLSYERAVKKDRLSEGAQSAIQQLSKELHALNANDNLIKMGFTFDDQTSCEPVQKRVVEGYWFRGLKQTADLVALDAIISTARALGNTLSTEEQTMVDFAIVNTTGFPAYLGGPVSLAYEMGSLLSASTNEC